MMKKGIALLTALALLLLPLLAGAEAGSTPLLYRVTDENGHTAYLLGTIHIGRKDMYPLSDAVEQAYAEAEILAVEADILAFSQDLVQMTQMSLALLYGPGDDASRHMSEEGYAQAIALLDYPEIVLKRMRLAGWISLAEDKVYGMAGLSSDWGVDMHLLRRAHADGKQIDELEGMAEQMEILLAMPDSIAEMQLLSDLDNAEEMAQMYVILLTAWQMGAEETFSGLLSEDEGDLSELPEELRAEYEQYMLSMYENRNDGFAQQVKDYLSEGKTVLVAVGAAHILGEEGLVDLLTRDGYTVEEIGR